MNTIKSEFDCYGHFYDLYLENRKIAECRSVLEIVRKKSELAKKNIITTAPDAIVIMMNPGTSMPIKNVSEVIEIINIENFFIEPSAERWVATEPDNTQSRIMNVMNFKGWNHVRVLNLSDIREENSNNLGGRIRDFEQETLSMIHSIFSPQRVDERANLLSNGDVPIILAWGTKSFMKKYAKRCLTTLKSREYFGVASPQSELYYYHPLIRKAWISEIKKLLHK
ncbi:DUF1643 domain-containing protein [Bacillus cereus]|uniref:DUF1643 domain-containing protein n=1 Tax=Bacillus cereus TaxID=1396 RepID=UPI00027ABA15|nr:DUF1643 domain-containing protein [Bacillus cereus]EJS68630.1 hypothetical protein ICY_04704 [Bacillus cereus BAG2X1-3]